MLKFFRFLLPITALLTTLACSTLRINHRYYLNSSKKQDEIIRKCEQSGKFGDNVLISYFGSQLAISIEYYGESSFFGPPLFPVIPIWFEGRESSKIFVYVFPSKGITIDRTKLRIKLSGNENWLSPIDLNSGGFWGSPAISFKSGNDVPPDSITLEIAGVMLDGNIQDIKQIEFERSRKWSYRPLIIPINYDFKPIRAENLPCN
ncbi:MAG: hypothetical protein ACXWRE_14880 [Pseudobdellovibrionaceae bacterium]